jgi:DNA repair exonuclease SbcCD ATPase subunit
MAAKVQITYEAEADSLKATINEVNKANDALEKSATDTAKTVTDELKKVGSAAAAAFGGQQVKNALAQLNKESVDLVASLKKLQDEQIKLINAGDRVSDTYKENAAAQEALKKKIAEVNKLQKDLNNTYGKTEEKQKTLTGQLRALKNELTRLEVEGKAGTKQFRDLTLAAAQLEDQIGDTRARVANLASDTFKFDAAVQATQGLAAGFEIAQGAAALFGSESEDLNKVIAKTTAVMAIANGVQQVAALLLDESALKTLLITRAQAAYSVVVGTSTGALKAFRIALAATGVGLLVVAIGALIANFDKLKAAIFGTSTTTDALKSTLESVRTGLASTIEETTKVGAAFELARAGVISKEEALLTYNETLGDAFGRTEDLVTAEAIYASKTQAYLKATALRTQAQALFAQSAVLAAEAATASAEDQRDIVDKSIAFYNRAVGAIGDVATLGLLDFTEAAQEINNKQAQLANERVKNEKNAQAEIITNLGISKLKEAEILENEAGIASETEQKINAQQAERTKAANDKAAEAAKKAAEDRAAAAKKAAEDQAAARKKLEELELQAFEATLTERQKISNEANKQVILLEETFRNAKFKAGSAAEIKALKELEAAKDDIIKNRNKALADLDKQELEKSLQRQLEAVKVSASATLQEQKLSLETQLALELDAAEKLGKDKVEINKRYAEQIDAINKQIAEAEVNTQINTLQRLEIEQGSSLDRRIQLIEIEAAKRKKEATDNIKDENERASAIQLIEAQTQAAIREERKKTTQETIDEALEIAQAIGNAFGSLADALKKQGDARIEFVQQAAADELEAINNSAKTEREKQRQREALELRTSRKIAEEKTKQARLDKQLALFNAIINTAAAIMKAGGPFTPIGALTAIAGAAQIATIAAQPIPKFAKGGLIGGRLHSAGGTLIEAERDEYIINRRQSVKHRRELDAINTSSAAFKKLIEERYVRPALLAYAGGRKNDAVIVNASLNSKSMEREIKGLRKDMRKQSTTVNINAYDTRYKWQ